MDLVPPSLNKVILVNTGGEANEVALRLAPPLSITEGEIDIAIDIIDEALMAVLASLSRLDLVAE